MCQVNEDATNLLAIAMLGLLLILVLYVIWVCKCRTVKRHGLIAENTSESTEVQEAKSALRRARRQATSLAEHLMTNDEPVVKVPKMIYFSYTAVARPRCFHSSETCSGLRRASSVCSAAACKLCVDKGTSASSSVD
jgi:hypothetical protein